jgi:hypothetical protein
MPAHGHAVIDAGHNHFALIEDHTHPVLDGGHEHGIIDRGHRHRTFEDAKAALIPVVDLNRTGAEVSTRGGGVAAFTTTSDSNIRIQRSASNIGLGNARPSIQVSGSTTGITVSTNGGGQPLSIQQASVAVKVLIKT